ncbi:ubiquitin carboxyl-terminal hydrolase 1 [Nematostella vectensis]|uniref:ubiquitin carboxyl-terminal hydrolase 1 n=1 Tax=Nematostella vectensis TaxID=45351 RepID=UPI00207763C5|nr:ubiquitin carboxyl-terminal hydrolase 1 [Nematostella vectensis]
MASVVSCTPPVSPHSPAKKKAKFSLRLKGKNKPKSSDDSPKKLHPIFSPVSESPDKSTLPQPPAFVGLKNRSNLCYANAVIQVLRNCPGFVDFVGDLDKQMTTEGDECHSKEESKTAVMVEQLSKLLHQLKEIKDDFIENKENCLHLFQRAGRLVLAADPADFMESFRQIYSIFENHLQHDSQEFLRTLIIALHEASKLINNNNNEVQNQNASLQQKPKSKARKQLILNKDGKFSTKEVEEVNIVEEMFQGRLVHETKCLTCENAKQRFEDFQDVSVPVHEDQQAIDAKRKLMLSPTPKKDETVKKHTLEWAISQFATVEVLKDNNKYFCENCCTYTEARLSTFFDLLPQVLTLHLKRFTSVYSGLSPGFVSKITSNLETPLMLSVYDWSSEACRKKCTNYELFGIVMHSGMTSCSGHYQAYVKVRSNLTKLVANNRGVECHNQETVQRKGLTNEESLDCSKKLQDNTAVNDESECFSKHQVQSSGYDCRNEQCSENTKAAESYQVKQELLNQEKDKEISRDGLTQSNECEGKDSQCDKKKIKGVRKSLRRLSKSRKISESTPASLEADDNEVVSSNACKRARLEQVTQPTATENTNNAEQTTCSFGLTSITKFFHKSRKKSISTTKDNESSINIVSNSEENDVTQRSTDSSIGSAPHLTGTQCKGGASSTCNNSPLSRSMSHNPQCTKKLQRSPAIRQLTFQVGEKGVTLSRESPKNKSAMAEERDIVKSKDEGVVPNQDRRNEVQEEGPKGSLLEKGLKGPSSATGPNGSTSGKGPYGSSLEKGRERSLSEWVHFDDSDVYLVDDADVASLLSSAESSFTSPYLLFYRRCDI